MENIYQIRVNGRIVTHLHVRNKLVDGMPCGEQEVAIQDSMVGWIPLDDNNSVLSGVPEFVIEMRDSTIPPAERRYLPNKGWERVRVSEVLARLEATGVLK